VAGAAGAQLYRWTDEKGRVNITDTPPPASARNIQKKATPRPGEPNAEAPDSFELAQALKNFPVTLYTTPNCAPCDSARNLLNRRGVPFKEILVANSRSLEELKKVASGNDLPVLMVGRSVHEGFLPEAFDSLLDSARYPKAGVLAPRAQAAPPLPPGASLKAEPVRPEAEEPAPTGPYAPGAPRQQRPQKK
jgi:glutaredoxin